ncbi:MAG: BMP family ABC transporter substrate-binding protein [Candidatus Asgardarchaeia archaeon]
MKAGFMSAGGSKIMNYIIVFIIAALIGAGATYAVMLPGAGGGPQQVTLKAAWIYVGPIGDIGWTYAHDQGRLYVQQKFSWLETAYIENVKEGEATDTINDFINQGYQVIFTTSFGFMDDTLQAAKNNPDVIFFHCSGYKRWKNMGTYFAEFYQLYYLNGLMAGALTKSNKVGYVAAHLIPEVVRHINAFALGVRTVNPNATVYVRVINAWYDPPKAREAAEALIDEGVDVLAFTEDSPTVIQVAQEHFNQSNGQEMIYVFAHYSPMYKYGPNVTVSGQLVHWEVIYEDILAKIYAGAYNTTNLENVDYWWMLKEGAVELGADFGMPINPQFVDDLKSVYYDDPILGNITVYDLVMIRLAQMQEETVLFDPFTGPIYAANGTLVLEPGERASHDFLWGINFYVEGVEGPPIGG